MAITIGSNIASLKTLRRLTESSSRLESIYERLSSGQRINRAADDAAGLAVAEGLRADSRIYAQAEKNVNDGISLLSVAESALGALNSILDRQKELAEQAANGSYSLNRRRTMHQESEALTEGNYSPPYGGRDFAGQHGIKLAFGKQ